MTKSPMIFKTLAELNQLTGPRNTPQMSKNTRFRILLLHHCSLLLCPTSLKPPSSLGGPAVQSRPPPPDQN